MSHSVTFLLGAACLSCLCLLPLAPVQGGEKEQEQDVINDHLAHVFRGLLQGDVVIKRFELPKGKLWLRTNKNGEESKRDSLEGYEVLTLVICQARGLSSTPRNFDGPEVMDCSLIFTGPTQSTTISLNYKIPEQSRHVKTEPPNFPILVNRSDHKGGGDTPPSNLKIWIEQ